MKLLQDKYSMNDTVHLTAVPGISVAKGGERELASAEVQESDTVRYVGPFDLRGGILLLPREGPLGQRARDEDRQGSSGKGQCQGCHGSHVSYTTYSDMCKSTNTSRSFSPLWDSCVLTSNNQVK